MSRAHDEAAGAVGNTVAAGVATGAGRRPGRRPGGRLDRRQVGTSPVVIAVIACAATVLANLDLFVVNVGLPDIGRGLHDLRRRGRRDAASPASQARRPVSPIIKETESRS